MMAYGRNDQVQVRGRVLGSLDEVRLEEVQLPVHDHLPRVAEQERDPLEGDHAARG